MDERDELALKLRQVLVEARNAAGLTQAELAKKLGRTQTFVSNYERGERKVGVVELVLIARALEFDPTNLIRRLWQRSSHPATHTTPSSSAAD